MSAELPSISDLLQRLQTQDAAAEREIFQRFAEGLAHRAEQQLSRRLAARVGASDIVQSVFRSFFERAAVGQFKVETSAQLWTLLVTITVRKAAQRARFEAQGVRDFRREETDVGAADEFLRSLARAPDPSEGVVLSELIDSVIDGLPPLCTQVLELRLAGSTPTEISRMLNVPRATIFDALERLGSRLERISQSE